MKHYIMIVDSMTKYEVMNLIRTDGDYVVKVLSSRLKAYHQMCIQKLGVNKKKYVAIPVPQITTDQELTYTVNFKANIEGYDFRCSTKFYYRNSFYYVDLTQEAISVFSSHSLDRYAERVLHDSDIGNQEVFERYMVKGMHNSFYIVLPSPTHKFTVYYVRSDAMFLGDMQTINEDFKWYNTCLSIDELYESQYRIYNSLGFMSKFINKLKFDPIMRSKNSVDNSKELERYLKVHSGMAPDYIKYLKYNYMLYTILKEFKIDELSEDSNIDQILGNIKMKLITQGVNPEVLNPYDVMSGIAIKGELDYIGDEQ